MALFMAQEQPAAPRLAPGQPVEVPVVALDQEYVYFDLGTRMEGMAKIADLTQDGRALPRVGETLNLILLGKEKGMWRLGRHWAAEAEQNRRDQMDHLVQAYERQVPVEGKVQDVVNGGVSVMLGNVRAFCPASQLEIRYTEDLNPFVGQTYSFLITRFEEGGRNLVLSRRQLLEQLQAEREGEVWAGLGIGQVCDGEVRRLVPYGAFVDIGGVEGLLHVSEMSWQRVAQASDLLSEGQKIQVKILDLDEEQKRLSLSMKALMEDPWLSVVKAVPQGAVVEGTVVRLKPFGAFVAIQDGVEGLLHISRMVSDRRLSHPRDLLQEGDRIMVRVMDTDLLARRIALEMVVETEEDQNRALLAAHQEEVDAREAEIKPLAGLLDQALKN